MIFLSSFLLHNIDFAPAFNALSQKSIPLFLSPLIAANIIPFFIFLESKSIPVILGLFSMTF